MTKSILTISAPTGLIAGLIGVALLTFAGVASADADEVALDADNPEITERGQRLYSAHCASCHGANLEGQPNWQTRRADGRLPAPPQDETGHTWHHPDQLLFEFTKFGPTALVGGDYQSDMQAFAEVLTDQEIIAVLSYIKSTWPAAIRRRHDAMNAAQ